VALSRSVACRSAAYAYERDLVGPHRSLAALAAGIECYYDERCRDTPGTVKRLTELLCNKDINAAMALVAGDEDSPSIVPQHNHERHHA
jgi:hypothetical protein